MNNDIKEALDEALEYERNVADNAYALTDPDGQLKDAEGRTMRIIAGARGRGVALDDDGEEVVIESGGNGLTHIGIAIIAVGFIWALIR